MRKAALVAMFLGTMLLIWIPVTGLAAVNLKGHILGIFGNANHDGVIDMRDVTHTERIIQGLESSQPLADSTYDGKVDASDITQTEKVIVGRETALTILDNDGDAVTVPRPVNRVIPDHMTSLAAMRVLDAQDMIVGIDTYAEKHIGSIFLQGLTDLPAIGDFFNPDYEAIVSLRPDVYLAYRSSYGQGGKKTLKEKLPGVTVVETGYYTPYNPENLTLDIRKLGYILGKRERAEAYIDWYNGYLNMIRQRVEELPADRKPRVYPAPGWDLYNSIANFKLADIAGGINICSGLGPTYVTVDPEWVIKQNPNVILKQSFASTAYDTDDASGMKAERDAILNRAELDKVDAVKKGRVYLWHMYTSGMFPNDIITIAYIAKWLHPDLFADLDPHAVHQEYLDRFTTLDFDVKTHGVFVYPPLEY